MEVITEVLRRDRVFRSVPLRVDVCVRPRNAAAGDCRDCGDDDGDGVCWG